MDRYLRSFLALSRTYIRIFRAIRLRLICLWQGNIKSWILWRHTILNFLVEFICEKIVCLCVCVCVQKLERTARWISLILHMQLGGLKRRKVTKPDFSGKFWFSQNLGKSAEKCRKSDLFVFSSNSGRPISLVLCKGSEANSGPILAKTACPGKFWFRT